MKLFVVARCWNDEKKDIVKEIVGTFDKPVFAMMFRDAYNDRYKANAYVVSEEHFINGDDVGLGF